MYNQNSIYRADNASSDVHVFKYIESELVNGSINIMIIDDSKKDIKLFEDLLAAETDLKFLLSKWTNAHEAIDALKRKEISPDLIILDLVMPCMNGKMVLHQIKSIPFLHTIPIIIHSSMNNYENALSLKANESHAFFAKPINAELFQSYVLGYNI